MWSLWTGTWSLDKKIWLAGRPGLLSTYFLPSHACSVHKPKPPFSLPRRDLQSETGGNAGFWDPDRQKTKPLNLASLHRHLESGQEDLIGR